MKNISGSYQMGFMKEKDALLLKTMCIKVSLIRERKMAMERSFIPTQESSWVELLGMEYS